MHPVMHGICGSTLHRAFVQGTRRSALAGASLGSCSRARFVETNNQDSGRDASADLNNYVERLEQQLDKPVEVIQED